MSIIEQVDRMIEVELYMPHLHCIWAALKTGIDKGFQTSAQDEAFLMETLSDVAKQDKETPDLFNLKLSYAKMRACWHVMNMLQKNDMIQSDDKRVAITQSMFFIAKALDNCHLMDVPPDDIKQADFTVKPVKASKTLLVIE